MESSLPSSVKLPSVASGRSSLVSSSSVVASESEDLPCVAAAWAKNIRRKINKAMHYKEDIQAEDICILKKELISAFNVPIQQNSHFSWKFLSEVLDLAEPYIGFLGDDLFQSQLYPHVELILHHAHLNRGHLLDVLMKVMNLFPELVNKIQSKVKFQDLNHSGNTTVQITLPTRKTRGVHKKTTQMRKSVQDNKKSADASILSTTQLTLRHLSQSLSFVTSEIASKETVWRKPLGTTALTMTTFLPTETSDLKHVVENLGATVTSHSLESVVIPSKLITHAHAAPDFQEEIPTMNGREAVQYFTSCRHLGQMRSLVLNLAPNRHYNPYDLMAVPKSKAEPEHYIFSSFGVLHVFPDRPSESLSLGQWQRETVLWTAVNCIPFFKHFLTNKAFYRWRSNCRQSQFQQRRSQIMKNLLTASPPFGSAILQISKLLQELLTVPFLPMNAEKTYSLVEFENCIHCLHFQGGQLLERCFRLFMSTVEALTEEVSRKVHYCEKQVRKRKNYQSKDSMSLQTKKIQDRVNNLKLAKAEMTCLGTLVKLLDQMITEHLFEITRSQAVNFVHSVLDCPATSSRDAFFKADLVVSHEGNLQLCPPQDGFHRAVDSALHGVPSLLMSYVTQAIHQEDELTNSQLEVNRDSYSNVSMTAANSTETKQVMPEKVTKEEEDHTFGTATPDLVIMHAEDFSPGVEGQSFCGQYAPLSTVSLEEKLLIDQMYQATLERSRSWMSAASKEIANFYEKNQWLGDVHQCCAHWTETSAWVFKEATAASIEKKLKELNQWSEKVACFDIKFYTENGSFCIDCSQLRSSLLVKLGIIYQDVYQLAESQARNEAATFASDMNTVLQNMADKNLEISSFASYAKNVKIYQKNTLNFQQKIDYIKSLYKVLRSNPQELTHEGTTPLATRDLEQSLGEDTAPSTARDLEQTPAEENEVEEKLMSLWQICQDQIQEASQFVTVHLPDMKLQLEHSLLILGQDAARLTESATTGRFVNPNPESYQILNELKAIQEQFEQVKKEIHQTSGWKEAITEESHSFIFLEEMSLKIDVRLELWNYVEAFRSTLKQWKCLFFKKMNIKKAEDKLTEWHQAAEVLSSLLPERDCVLTSWCQQMQTFSQDLPLLNKLTDSSLQERHWQSLFLAWNRSYDARHELTVADLLSLHLSQHSDLIHATHRRALAECALEQNLNAVSSFWQAREFRLTKYIPECLMSVSTAQRTSSSNNRLGKLEQFRQQRTASFQKELKRLDVTNDDLFVLSDLEELTYDLEDSRISVEAMLTFPHVEHIRDQVVSWQRVLRSIQEITEVWAEAQKKWQYLLKIFQQPKLYQQLPEQAARFEEVHSKFKEWMRVVSSDPKCLSVVGRQRKEKGYRLLQGDNLKTLLMFVMTEQEEILKHLDKFLEKARTIFPRLYFLSDRELIDLLGVFVNLPATVPYVQKCFPAVQGLHFSLPADFSRNKSAMDHALNRDKLDVISVTGELGEEISLCRPVVAVPAASKWLQAFCATFKDTLTISMRSCVKTGMEEGLQNVSLVLEDLSQLSDSKDREVSSSPCHWLVRFPNQCVITAQAVIWAREMTRVLEQQLMQELRIARSNLNAEISQMSQVLQTIKSHKKIRSSDGQRLQLLVCGLLCQSIYHRDIMTGLIDSNQVTDTAFDWLKILKFFMEVRNVLRAKTVLPERSSSAHTMKADCTLEGDSCDSNYLQNNKGTPGEAPRLSRARTTISTDLQFGACYIQQLNHVFSYDYEYLGPCHHLVVTPLTERAFLTLGQALSKFQCGTLVGPSGTGKSATIRELAGLLGRSLFSVKCGQDISLSSVVQYLTGTVQSGCWALFDDCDKMSNGLLSAVGQQLDYLSSALRALSVGCTNQYQIRGHSHFDKVFSVKLGTGDKVIRRNSLTTLHPLPRVAVSQPPHSVERQKSVPHGFNERGLVTYFEDTWVAERDQRQQSVEREIEIIESDLYRNNKPPSLLYEHVRINKKRPTEDFSRLAAEPLYVHRLLGNVMFDGKLIAASSNFGCFMTLEADKLSHVSVPLNLTMLLRPCALVVPDLEYIISVTLESYGYHDHRSMSKKLIWLIKSIEIEMCSEPKLRNCLRTIKKLLLLAAGKKIELLSKARTNEPIHENLMKSVEESSLVYSVKETFGSYFDAGTEYQTFLGLCRDAFPGATESDVLVDQTLVLALNQLFKDNHLENNKPMIDKILQLHTALEIRAPVLLVGPPGCGKSKMCSALAGVINSLHHQVHQTDHPTREKRLAEHSHLHFQLPRKLRLLKELDRKLKSENTDESEETYRPNAHGPIRQASKMKEESAQISGINISAHKKIDILHLLPCAMSPSELLGACDEGSWHGGLLGAVLRQWQGVEMFMNTQKTPASRLYRWLVLDGDLDPSWTEGIKNILGDTNCLTLGNGERIFLKDSVSVIFETCSLQKACPATVSMSQVVHCGADCNTWSALYFTWRLTAGTKWFIPTIGLKLLDELVKDVFPATLNFLQEEEFSLVHADLPDSASTSGCTGPGITQVSAFLSIFSALLDRSLRRADTEKTWLSPPTGGPTERPTTSSPSSHEETSTNSFSCSVADATVPHYTDILKGLFVYSYIWAFGGSLHDRSKEKFSNRARQVLLGSQHSLVLPQHATVFDYYFDINTANFVNWSSHRLKNHVGFIITPQVESYLHLMDVLVGAQQPVLLVGAPGVGKTSMVKHLLQSKTSSKSVNMSRSVTSAVLLKLLINGTMEKQLRDHVSTGGLLVGRARTKETCLFFIDDLNMASTIGNYQPSLELVRSVLTLGGTYDSERRNFLEMGNVTFIAAVAGPIVSGNGLGSRAIRPRLSRQFVTLTVHAPSSDSLCSLYTHQLHSWLEEFPSFSSQHHSQLAKTMCQALLEVYSRVKAQLAPTPLLPQYVFTLHDLARVVHGILLMSSRTSIKKSVINFHEVDVKNPVVLHQVMTQLWCHEVSRSFRDRMMTSKDHAWFNQVVEEIISKQFCSHKKGGSSEDRLKPEDASTTGDLQNVEKLTGAGFIIFSRFYMAVNCKNHEPHSEKDYTQQTESMLAAALRGCLEKYNQETGQPLRLVFFTQAVHHAARVSRVLAYPGGHAVLLSTGHCTGRRSLVRLAAFIGQCQVFEPRPQLRDTQNLAAVLVELKLACFQAGVTGKPAALLVHEDLGEACFQVVNDVMAGGWVAGLYTDREVEEVASCLLPGGIQTKRVDQIEKAFQKFLRRVRQNLHVFICLSHNVDHTSRYPGRLHHLLQTYPGFIKNSFSIDVYHPWSHVALTQVATSWLEEAASDITVPWTGQGKIEQMKVASRAMAYIHLSAIAAWRKQCLYHPDIHNIFSPHQFQEFIHLFKMIAISLLQAEKLKGERYEKALAKIDEAFGSIEEYKRKVSDLMPMSSTAGGAVHGLVAEVETLKSSYKQALDKCKLQEEKIIRLQAPLEKLQSATQTELNKVNPTYQAAVTVLNTLDQNAVEEIRSYSSPPEGVKLVMRAVCMLFRKPQTWEHAKTLLVDAGFFQELIFYHKDNMAEDIFKELKNFVTNPDFTPESVAQASSAAASVCAWIHALFAYINIHQNMRPHMRNLEEMESNFRNAQAELGHLRMEAHRLKADLQQYISQHKQALKVARAYEKQIKVIERKIARANDLMENMSVQHFLWRSELKRSRQQQASALGDGLISAAFVIYLAPFRDRQRSDLLQDWLNHLRQNAFGEEFDAGNVKPEVVDLELLWSGGQEFDHKISLSSCKEKVVDADMVLLLSQVKTCRYSSVVYDTSDYYKYELTRPDTVQTTVPESSMDDSDDDDTCILPIRSSFAIQEILSNFEELIEWRKHNMPTDLRSIQNALILNTCHQKGHYAWPLLIDPDDQAVVWIRTLHQGLISTQQQVEAIETESSSLLSGHHSPAESSSGRETTLEADGDTWPGTHSSDSSSHSWLNSASSDSATASSQRNAEESYSQVKQPSNISHFQVIMADDSDLKSKLVDAVMSGTTVLISHLERKPFEPALTSVMLKQLCTNKDGSKTVMVGDTFVTCNPGFCLFLSTSVPLYVKGDGFYNLPLNQTLIVDLALSDEAIMNILMLETIKVEKKEFEGQKRANENYLIQHRQSLAREHEIIREKTLNLAGPLLEDETMLESLKKCQDNLEHNRQFLEDTLYMGDHLEDKFSHYKPFIKHSTMLYRVLQRMQLVCPHYYVPFAKFKEIFVAVITSRDRGKGSRGATQARAQELSNAVLTAVLSYVQLLMSEQHFMLLLLFLSLERQLLYHRASRKELGSFVQSFLGTGPVSVNILSQKPHWLSEQAWINCHILQSLHQPFTGLIQSLISNSQPWYEYFQKKISLLSSPSGLVGLELSIFQKCLLWKIVRPQRMAELVDCLITCELGSDVPHGDGCDIQEIYKLTHKNTPTIFLLPPSQKTPDTSYTMDPHIFNPIAEVKKLAREIGMEGKVRLINLAVVSNLSEVSGALTDCMQLGHWLLLLNYHLCQQQDPAFLTVLKDIIYSCFREESTQPHGGDNDESRTSMSSLVRSSLVQSSSIHSSFRLWLTTCSGHTKNNSQWRLLPGLVVQHGLKVTPKAGSNFGQLLSRTYKSAASFLNQDSSNELESVPHKTATALALLHSIIQYNCHITHNDSICQHLWSLTDLATAAEIIQTLPDWTSDIDAVTDLAASVYSFHCVDLQDGTFVASMARDLIQCSGVRKENTQPDETSAVQHLCLKLIQTMKTTGDVHERLASQQDSSHLISFIPEDTKQAFQEHNSRILHEEISHFLGNPGVHVMKVTRTPSTPMNPAQVVESLQALLSICPEMPDHESDRTTHLDIFFSHEYLGLSQLLKTIQGDLNLLHRVLEGEITVTSHMQDMLDEFDRDKIPTRWQQSSSVPCSSLREWLSQLPEKMNYIKACLSKDVSNLALNMFLHPDRLLWAIRQTFAAADSSCVGEEVSLKFEVAPRQPPPAPVDPQKEVHITGLQIKNATWNSSTSALSETTEWGSQSATCPDMVVRPCTDQQDTASSDHYMCPVYSVRDWSMQADQNLLCWIPLKTLVPSQHWAQKRVALTLAKPVFSSYL